MLSDEEQLKQLRKDIFLTAYAGGIGHIPSAYSIVEILYALYCKGILKYDAKNPYWQDRDRLICSKGHASLAIYAVLSLIGCFPKEELKTFSRPGTRLGGEPNPLEIPYVEASTGSLGHGLSIGVGMALAQKIDKRDCKTYVIIGDGESQEGTIWEAAMSAVKFKLDNLTVILDNNKVQKMGFVSDIMGICDWHSKWESFGWEVYEADGHNLESLIKCFNAESKKDKPKIIIADTIKGKGVSIMENAPEWHYKMPNKRQMKIVMTQLNISETELQK
ncbi:MAG: transketolase [Elusimicrobiota bacterium]|jgi:transketolase|nr:transketolase [Elusimicrobiota bacterium]